MNNVAVYPGLITAKLVWARNQESKRAEIGEQNGHSIGNRGLPSRLSRANFFVFDYLGAHNYPVYIFLPLRLISATWHFEK